MNIPLCHKCADGLFALNVSCPHKSQTFVGCRRDSRITSHTLACIFCAILPHNRIIDVEVVSTVVVPAKRKKNPKRKVVNHLTRLTPTEWSDLFGVEVIDPDGWRGAMKPDWNTPITRDMFKTRYQMSTCRVVDKKKYAQWQHFLG